MNTKTPLDDCLTYGQRHAAKITVRIGTPDGIVTLSSVELATMLAAAWSDGYGAAFDAASAIIDRTTAALEQEHLGTLSTAERVIAKAMNKEGRTQ